MSKQVVEALQYVLADSYVLYLKTQNYHWNVTGPNFHSLHVLFEEQYNDLAAAIDEIAERIRALGAKAQGSFSAYTKLASIEEASGNESAQDMVAALHKDQATIIRSLSKALELAQEADDEVSADLLIGRTSVHEKANWMLASILA